MKPKRSGKGRKTPVAKRAGVRPAAPRRKARAATRAAAAPRASSRDPRDLHPELARRWELARSAFASRHPELAQVFLTQSYRSAQDQAADYARGRTAPGKVVTNAQPGQSLHNYYPALAFDIAFRSGKTLHWEVELFRQFAVLAKSFGLEWGGDWKSFKDNPHFQPPGYTWRMAKQGIEPAFRVNA